MRPPSNASQVRVAAANSGCDSQSQLVTDGRTDEPQTKIQTAINEQSATRAHVQGFVTEVVSFADVLESGFMHTGRRFPVTRVGQTWHQRGPMEDANLIAFCAHCGVVGMTDVTL